MRSFSAPLYPKPVRKARIAEAYGKGASSDPGAQRAAASRMFQSLGGKMVRPKLGGRKVKRSP